MPFKIFTGSMIFASILLYDHACLALKTFGLQSIYQHELWECMDQSEERMEFHWPWTMIPLEQAGEWIDEVKKPVVLRIK